MPLIPIMLAGAALALAVASARPPADPRPGGKVEVVNATR
jgi:hypothetical protein